MLRTQLQHLHRLMWLQLQLFRVYELYPLTVTLVLMNLKIGLMQKAERSLSIGMVDKQH